MIFHSISKAILLRSCAPAALAGVALVLPQAASAQAFQGTPTVAAGTVNIDRTVIGVDTITVTGTDAVIDWTPDFGQQGELLTFLPVGNTANFRSTGSFAVLNRVLNTNTLDPIVFEGLVRSYFIDTSGIPTGQGGTVAFYSPTGILIGATGRFEVPQLLLTSHDVNPTSFAAFAAGSGSLELNGSSGPQVSVVSGATFSATAEGSYLIIAAPSITMAGDASVNGSVAYVASNAVQMTHGSGLFDIVITEGTQARSAITHTGNTGGPSSGGSGDEHVIYAVAQTGLGALPATMLFSGNLGFQPAGSAGVVNGDIILSANYNVSQRTVDGGQNRLGVDSYFGGGNSVDFVPLTIELSDLSTTSNLLAIGTHQTNLTGTGTYGDDVVLVGREQALVSTATGDTIEVNGDLFVSARNFRNRDPSGNSTNSTGGFASVYAEVDSLISVQGRTALNADGIAGINSSTGQVGTAVGGQAQIMAHGGLVRLIGAAEVSADAYFDQQGFVTASGTMTGGRAEALAVEGGTLDFQDKLSLFASAISPEMLGSVATPAANATGGRISFGVGTNGGSLTVVGDTLADASAFVGNSGALTGVGGRAWGGTISLSAIDGGTLSFGAASLPGGKVELNSDAFGGNMAGGTGGRALAGVVEISVRNSTATFGGQVQMRNDARGGSGDIGGAAIAISNPALGLFSRVNLLADNSTVGIGGALDMTFALAGGNAGSTGAGGDATGGVVSVSAQSASELTVTGATSLALLVAGGDSPSGLAGDAVADNASIAISGASQGSFAGVTIRSISEGGFTGTGSGGIGEAGTGRIQITTGGLMDINGALAIEATGLGGAVDPSAAGAGGLGIGGIATVNVIGIDSRLHVTGTATLSATGAGGAANDGQGGNAELIASATGQLGELRIDGAASLSAEGFGGIPDLSGLAGDGNGGATLVDAQSAGMGFGSTLSLSSNGYGANGVNAGDGRGGLADVKLLDSRITTVGNTTVTATGTGGNATGSGNAGSGRGGAVSLQLGNASNFSPISSTIGFNATGTGGNSVGGTAGAGFGGGALVSALTGSVLGVATTNLALIAQGIGGGSNGGGDAGAATGGTLKLEGGNLAQITLGNALMDTRAVALESFANGAANAIAGDAEVTLQGASLSGTALNVLLDAQAAEGNSQGGRLVYTAGNGSNGGFTNLNVSATANTGAANFNITGGSARIETLAGTASNINLPSVSMTFSTSGSLLSNPTPGFFDIVANSGQIASNTIRIEALNGANGTTTSRITAAGGNVRIATQLDVNVNGNVLLTYGQGNQIINTLASAPPADDFTVTSGGTITLAGDNAASSGIIGGHMVLVSNDIDIQPQASASAQTFSIYSTDTFNPATIGGLVEGPGYTLSQPEVNNLVGRRLEIFLPNVVEAAAPTVNLPDDAVFEGLQIDGSQGNGFSQILLHSDGDLVISGLFDYDNAAATDVLTVEAGDVLKIPLLDGGGILIRNNNGAFSGRLNLIGDQIIAAPQTLLDLILFNPSDPTIASLLADDGGSTNAAPYIGAATVGLSASDYILMQNTGANGLQAGIQVGDGGLAIDNLSQTEAQLHVIVYGTQVGAAGEVTGFNFFDETVIAENLNGPFTNESTLNDCVISQGAGSCGTPPQPEPEFSISLTNSVLTEGPLTTDISEVSMAIEQLFFGPEFPNLIDAPLISEDTMVNDPVTSGGDSAASTSIQDDEDEENDDAS